MNPALLYRRIHGARSGAGLSEDVYRDNLEQRYQTRHLSALDGGQLKAELTRLNKLPKVKATGKRKQLEGPYVGKLQALWLSGWNLGVVEDRRDEAMLKFIERQTGIQRTEFLRDHGQAEKVIEALKGWLQRDGGVDWKVSKFKPSWASTPQFQVVYAQVLKLQKLGHFHAERATIDQIKEEAGGGYLGDVTVSQWIDIQKRLGVIIRGEE